MKRVKFSVSSVMNAGRVAVSAAILAAAVVSCEGEAPVPAKPTWLTDVQPILRGNCFHCHGSDPAAAEAGAWQFQVYEKARYKDKIGVEPAGLDAKMIVASILMDIKPGEGEARAKMPPPPALPLSERDIEVIEKWAEHIKADPVAAFGERKANKKPTIPKSSIKMERLTSGKLRISFVADDGDFDVITGKLEWTEGEETFNRSGGHTMTLNVPMGRKITARLTDGIDLQMVEVGTAP